MSDKMTAGFIEVRVRYKDALEISTTVPHLPVEEDVPELELELDGLPPSSLCGETRQGR